jgi:phenylacetate-CoA ligase
MSTFTALEKNRIFIERTQDLWPENWEYYLELIKHEIWTPEELKEYNFRKRVETLIYAYENTTFYKKLYDDAGVNPYGIKSEEDWQKVPIVTKQMVADNSSDFEVKEFIERFGFSANTGGSTGNPLRVFRDRRHFWQAPFWRFYGWHLGRECGNPDCYTPIWGLDEANITRAQFWHTGERLRSKQVAFWPKNFFYLSPYSSFAKDVDKFIAEVSKSPLAKIYAYAGGMDMLADYCIKHNIKFPNNIVFADLCATPVTNVLREKIKAALGIKVFDFYGSNEMGPMAVECCESGSEHHLHVLSDLLAIELVDDNMNVVEDGETGTTIITDFRNRVFPFVRYNHGDRTHYIKGNCRCGLPFPIIAPVRGRTSDFLTTRSGLNIDGVGFNEIFDHHPQAVCSFQFRQKKNGYADFLVVPNKRNSNFKDEIDFVFNKLQTDFDGEIIFTLKYVDVIEYDGGKIRYIVHE